MTTRRKREKDENFPVAFKLFSPQNRQIISCYYQFARLADDIADNPRLSPKEKLQRLDLLEKTLYGQKGFPVFCKPAARLRKVFMQEGLDFSLAADLLTAFRRDAEGMTYETWGQLTNYCQYSAAPVGRFLLALHNENPSTYLPAASLCAALQIVNHIQDAGSDKKSLNRVYFPKKILQKHKLTSDCLDQSSVSPALRLACDEILAKTEEQLKDAAILPHIVHSLPLKIEICVIINLTNIMIYKLKKKDFLAEEIRLSKCDWLFSSVKGTLQGIFARKKTLSTKGI